MAKYKMNKFIKPYSDLLKSILLVVFILVSYFILGQNVKLPIAVQGKSNLKSKQSQTVNNKSSNSVNNYYKSPAKTTRFNGTNIKIDYYQSAIKKTNSKDYAGAKTDYEKAIAINPNNSDMHFNYGLLLIEYFNDQEKARQHIETAIAQKPNESRYHYLYGTILKIFFNNINSARNHYLIATKLKPSLINHDSDKFFGVNR